MGSSAYNWFQRTQVFATGGFGPSEQLMPPGGSLGEALDANAATFETTCGSWAVFKMCRYLLCFTGQAKYGDWVEKILYNGIGAALPLQPDGRTFYYSDYRVGAGLKVYREDQRWSCCSGTYPQSIADYHNLIYFHNREGLYVNLFVPSDVSWNGITLTQRTSYPEEPVSELTVSSTPAAPWVLGLRIPGWCRHSFIEVNGIRQDITCDPGAWAILDRTWKPGDRVSIHLPMQLSFVPVDAQHRQRVALVYGPVALVRKDAQLSENSLASVAKHGKWFRLLENAVGDDQFVPFYTIGFRQPYQMYFDLE